MWRQPVSPTKIFLKAIIQCASFCTSIPRFLKNNIIVYIVIFYNAIYSTCSSKKEGIYQESIQSSTTPDPGCCPNIYTTSCIIEQCKQTCSRHKRVKVRYMYVYKYISVTLKHVPNPIAIRAQTCKCFFHRPLL